MANLYYLQVKGYEEDGIPEYEVIEKEFETIKEMNRFIENFDVEVVKVKH